VGEVDLAEADLLVLGRAVDLDGDGDGAEGDGAVPDGAWWHGEQLPANARPHHGGRQPSVRWSGAGEPGFEPEFMVLETMRIAVNSLPQGRLDRLSRSPSDSRDRRWTSSSARRPRRPCAA